MRMQWLTKQLQPVKWYTWNSMDLNENSQIDPLLPEAFVFFGIPFIQATSNLMSTNANANCGSDIEGMYF